MYNIHSHYENIFSFLKTQSKDPVLLHFFPFGSIEYENLEIMHCNGSGSPNSPLVLCFDQEPITNHLINIIQKVRADWGLGKKIILLNTENNSLIKKQILSDLDIIDCYYFFHIFAASDWYRGYQYCNDIISPEKRKINKKYITFNRITGSSRAYRSLFISNLHKYNLLDFGHVSYSDHCPVHGGYKENLMELIEKHNVSPKIVYEAVQHLKHINFPLRIDNKSFEYIPNGSQTIDALPEMMESFLHVVTETCFWEQKQHLTEKIFKPIVAKQPFLLLGCANNLSYIREYGFKTFDKWWDESYDSIEDPIERINAVTEIIRKISTLSNSKLESLLEEMKLVLDYNYNLFFSKEFVDNAWQELNKNIEQSIFKRQWRNEKKLVQTFAENYEKIRENYKQIVYNERSWQDLQSNLNVNMDSINIG